MQQKLASGGDGHTSVIQAFRIMASPAKPAGMTDATLDAVVLAAGRGLRLGGAVPKQYLDLGDKSVLSRTLAPFINHPRVRRTIVTVGADDGERARDALGGLTDKVSVVIGGETRQASVRAALDALADAPPDQVLIHDGARPFVSGALIGRVADALATHPAVIPATPVADTLKRVIDGAVTETVPRDGLAQAQTPQGFHFAPFYSAHRAAAGDGSAAATDDAGLMEANGVTVRVVDGERTNFKITTQDDLAVARQVSEPGTASVAITGQGFDVHRIVAGGPLILGGLTIDAPFTMLGHSDADVALHTLTDAIFGALGDGDIGHHFPPSDETWRGAASDQFLAFAAKRARSVGEIAHLDLTIICERPKIGPHRDAMRARIAEITGVPVGRVSVKATTTERLGFTGRGEGIAALATATVLRPIAP